MWFAKNNLCKVYREDSTPHRVYIPISSQLNKQIVNDENIRQAYFVSGINNSSRSQSKNKYSKQNKLEQIKTDHPTSFTQLKDKNVSNYSKNLEDTSETNIQTSQNIHSINFLKELKNNTSSQQFNTSQDYQHGPFSFKEVNRRKTNHDILTSDTVSQSQLSLSSKKSGSPLKQKVTAISYRNDKIESKNKEQAKKQLEHKQETNTMQISLDNLQKQTIKDQQIHLKTEEELPILRQIITPIFNNNNNRKSLDSLNFSKYMNFVETKRDKSIKNIIEKEQIMKENNSSQLNKLPQINNQNANLELLQQLLTPRSRPSMKPRNQNNNNQDIEQKEQYSNNFSHNLTKKDQNINLEQCSSISSNNFSYFNLKKKSSNENVEFQIENQIQQKRNSDEQILEQNQKQFNSPQKKKCSNNNLLNTQRQIISSRKSPIEQKNSINRSSLLNNEMLGNLFSNRKKSIDPQEQKQAIFKEKQEQVEQKKERMRQEILLNEQVQKLIAEIIDYLQFLLHQEDISKKQMKRDLINIFLNKQHILDVLSQKKILLEKATAEQLQELIIEGITSNKFLSLHLSKENIIKEVIIPDLFLFKDKLTIYCKNKQENQLKKFKESILQEQNSIHNLELNRIYSDQIKLVEKQNQLKMIKSNHLLSDIVQTNQPLQKLETIERKLGEFSLIKQSGRIQSQQITSGLQTLKDRKSIQKQEFEQNKLNQILKNI